MDNDVFVDNHNIVYFDNNDLNFYVLLIYVYFDKYVNDIFVKYKYVFNDYCGVEKPHIVCGGGRSTYIPRVLLPPLWTIFSLECTITSMATVKLTKHDYLGEGYVHEFRHNETGELSYVACTKEEYDSLSMNGGSANTPTLTGHTWTKSLGGTIKVDTPSTLMSNDEYVVVNGEALIFHNDRFSIIDSSLVVNDEVDDQYLN